MYVIVGLSIESMASGWTLLCEAQYKVHDNAAAEKSAKKGKHGVQNYSLDTVYHEKAP